MARMNRPAPVEVSYKHMRFLITHNPTNATLSTFIEVSGDGGVAGRGPRYLGSPAELPEASREGSPATAGQTGLTALKQSPVPVAGSWRRDMGVSWGSGVRVLGDQLGPLGGLQGAGM